MPDDVALRHGQRSLSGEQRTLLGSPIWVANAPKPTDPYSANFVKMIHAFLPLTKTISH
jgi:hypothetical protein